MISPAHRFCSAILTFLLVTAGCGGAFAAPRLWEVEPSDPPFSSYLTQRPWLLERSLWATHLAHPGEPSHEALGAYGVGNGEVFTLVGLTYPLSTLHNTIGPVYRFDEFEDLEHTAGFFGDISFTLLKDGQAVALTDEWAWKVKGTGVVLTKVLGEGLDLETVDSAPRGLHALLRTLVVVNRGDTPAENVKLRISVVAPIEAPVRTPLGLQAEAGRYRVTIGSLGAPHLVDGTDLLVSLGRLEPGAEAVVPMYLIFTENDDDPAATLAQIQRAGSEALLEADVRWWREWTGGATAFTTPDPKINDLITDSLVVMKTQQAKSGAICPMSRYTLTWIRDTIGPVMLLTRAGMGDEARTMMEYYYKQAWARRTISNAAPVDVDIENLPPEPDWTTVGFMDSRRKSEAPSYIPMMYDLYYRQTGDWEFLASHYDYFRACVLRQEVTPEGFLPHNGDETFIWSIRFLIGDLSDPRDTMYSSNASFLILKAAQIVQDMARRLGRTEDVPVLQELMDRVQANLDQYYWMPSGYWSPAVFVDTLEPVQPMLEDVDLIPFWSGYVPFTDARAKATLLKLIEANGRPGGRVQYHADVEIATGMVPGYYLWNLAAVDHPLAEEGFNAYIAVLPPSGDFSEDHWYPSGDHSILLYDATGMAGDITATYRPWEGGINMEALLFYLYGMQPDVPSGLLKLHPHFPNDWQTLDLTGGKLGAETFDAHVLEMPTGRRVIVTNHGPGDFNLTLTFSFDERPVTDVVVDGQSFPVGTLAVEREWGRLRITAPRTPVRAGRTVTIEARYEQTKRQVYAAGYLQTALSSTEGGDAALVAFVGGTEALPPGFQLHLLDGWMDTGIELKDDGRHGDFSVGDGWYGAMLPAPPGLPQGWMLYQVASPSGSGGWRAQWPFLVVE